MRVGERKRERERERKKERERERASMKDLKDSHFHVFL